MLTYTSKILARHWAARASLLLLKLIILRSKKSRLTQVAHRCQTKIRPFMNKLKAMMSALQINRHWLRAQKNLLILCKIRSIHQFCRLKDVILPVTTRIPIAWHQMMKLRQLIHRMTSRSRSSHHVVSKQLLFNQMARLLRVKRQLRSPHLHQW